MKLLEITKSTDSATKLDKLLTGDYSQAWDHFIKTGRSLYRGIERNSTSYFIEDPSTRTSNRHLKGFDTGKFVNLLYEIDDGWKGVPDRRRSLFVTAYRGNATEFGAAYYVFPKNDSIFVESSADWNLHYWPNFSKKLGEARSYDLSNMIKKIELIFLDVTHAATGLKSDARNFEIDVFRKNWNDCFNKKLKLENYSKILTSDFDSWFAEALDFHKNNFKIVNVKQALSTLDASEYWTQHSCLMIHEREIYNYQEKYAKD